MAQALGFARRSAVRWWRALPAAVVGVAAAANLAVSWGATVASHPAYLVTLIIVGVASIVIAASAIFERAARAAPESGPTTAPRRRWRWVGRATGVVAAFVVVAVMGYLRPLPASDVAIDALGGTSDVTVSETSTRIVLRPTGAERNTGLIFYPGALVEPRAYVPILTPIAADGYAVWIVKAPFNIALTDRRAAAATMDSNSDIDHWVVAGHSLGGVTAASVAGSDDRVRGLALWASFPNSSLAGQSDLEVTSISGSEDGLSTPAKIDASAADLPAATEFVAVEGATHAFFGDYGTQEGDGTATIERADAQAQIQAATLALLASVDASP